MSRRGRPPYPDLLTPREAAVLELLREGLTNPQIAERLGMSLDGAKYHVSEILSKLGVSSREEAARWRAPTFATAAWLWRRIASGLRLKLDPVASGLGAVLLAGALGGLGLVAFLLFRGGAQDEPAVAGPTAVPTPVWRPILDRPRPDFRAIEFTSEDDGWLLGSATLVRTHDGGETWTETERQGGSDEDFADATHGWIVGSDGTILATTNGETWREQRSGTDVHLSDVFAVSADEAWAVGSGKGYSDVVVYPEPTALLHTADGGATWRVVETPPGSWFREVTFLGERGWVFGARCEVWRRATGEPACSSPATGAVAGPGRSSISLTTNTAGTRRTNGSMPQRTEARLGGRSTWTWRK